MAIKTITLTDPHKKDRAYDEAIKNLRTSVQFAGMNIKCILMTSTFPNEGKSDLSFQLAKELGNIDKKVLLLDADIRNSSFVGRYNAQGQDKGLSHYLSGQAPLDAVLSTTNYKNVDMILAGFMAPNPSELLEGPAMGTLIAELKNYYDYILIDTPPALSVADAVILSKWCDGAIQVVEAGKVSYHAAQKAKAMITQTGCKLLGVVLNKVDTKIAGYGYGKYGYGKYGYGKYYGKGADNTEAK